MDATVCQAWQKPHGLWAFVRRRVGERARARSERLKKTIERAPVRSTTECWSARRRDGQRSWEHVGDFTKTGIGATFHTGAGGDRCNARHRAHAAYIPRSCGAAGGLPPSTGARAVIETGAREERERELSVALDSRIRDNRRDARYRALSSRADGSGGPRLERLRAPRQFVRGGPLTPVVTTSSCERRGWLSRWRGVSGELPSTAVRLVPYDVTTTLPCSSHLMFLQGLLHLGFKMLALWRFGTELESLWGSRRFHALLLVTGSARNLIGASRVELVRDAIGASGAYGILEAYGTLPGPTSAYLVVPTKRILRLIRAITFWSSLGIGSGVGRAHWAGCFRLVLLRGFSGGGEGDSACLRSRSAGASARGRSA